MFLMEEAQPANKPYLWGARALMLGFAAVTIWMIRQAWRRKSRAAGPVA